MLAASLTAGDTVSEGGDLSDGETGALDTLGLALSHLSSPPGGGGGGGGGGWLAAWPASVLIVGSTAASGCVEQLEQCSSQQCGVDTVSQHITSITSNPSITSHSVDTSSTDQ